jgi:hypothetical protein
MIKLLLTILLLYTSLLFATNVNGRFDVIGINGSTFSVKVQISTNTGTDDMGGATIPISYNQSVLSMPSVLVNGVHYIYHNFSGGNYSPATVTRNIWNGVYQIWLNIDLPFYHSDSGTVVALMPSWTDVVTLNFTIANPTGQATLTWLTTSPFWGIYDGNNTTMWNIGSFNNLEYALPVELSSFTGQQLGNDVELLWTTETEVNNFGFDIERKTNNSNWQKIGFMSGAGNSNSPKHYQFIDNNVSGGSKFNYRLKQIDTDGNYEYSDIIEIVIIPTQFILYQNYPNPFNPLTTIKYEIPVGGNVKLSLYDISGMEVMSLINTYQDVGIYSYKLDASKLSSGVYFYKFVINNFVQVKKLLLLK